MVADRDGLVAELFVHLDTPIREVIKVIDRSGRISLALLVDDVGRLEATITDGDIRRAIMAGLSLEATVDAMMPIKAKLPNPDRVTAPFGTGDAALLLLLQERHVRQIPLLDADGRVVSVALLADLLPLGQRQMHAVIMAGGLGTRLRPLTDELPKPMLPVGGRPLMERIVSQLRRAGIHQIIVTTHYKPEKIVDHFGDGRDFDVHLEYVHEDEPLGTVGALGLIPAPTEPLLVVNGDVLTSVDFEAMLDYHQEQRADMTVGVRHYAFQVPYGVVECDGSRVLGVSEKPQLSFFVNAGIYLLEPAVCARAGCGVAMHMTDLIQQLIDTGLNVVSFPVLEYWTDIGQHADYLRAQSDAEDPAGDQNE